MGQITSMQNVTLAWHKIEFSYLHIVTYCGPSLKVPKFLSLFPTPLLLVPQLAKFLVTH